MKVAIIILNWNGKKLLETFLPSVLEHSGQADVYVADNASTDDSLNYMKQHHPQVKCIKNPENKGYAGGYNQALKQVDADVYCLLNSDIEASPGWLNPIIRLMEGNTRIAVVQPKILDYNRRDYFEYAGAAGGFIDQLAYPYCRGRIFESIEKDEGQYNDSRKIFWASGACMCIRRDVFWELDGFDEDYFAHQEEIDLCWRIQNRGYEVWYAGTSVVYHVGGATLDKMNPQKTFLNFRNSLFSITKNLPLSRALTLVFYRLVLDGITGVYFLLQGKFSHVRAIVKAHISYYAHVRTMLEKRNKGPFTDKYYDCTSIVWEYFVYHKKKYSQLVKD